MPRTSPEERSASFYRAGKTAPDPPKGMTREARQIWREIVASKPIDWFDANSLRMLRLHCENMAKAEQLSVSFAVVAPGSKEFGDLNNQMKTLGAILATSSRQLRLTVQAAVDWRESKSREKAPDALAPQRDSGVLGGHASRH